MTNSLPTNLKPGTLIVCTAGVLLGWLAQKQIGGYYTPYDLTHEIMMIISAHPNKNPTNHPDAPILTEYLVLCEEKLYWVGLDQLILYARHSLEVFDFKVLSEP